MRQYPPHPGRSFEKLLERRLTFTSTTAPMTEWILPSLAESLEAKRCEMMGAAVLGWKARKAGLRADCSPARAARAMPLAAVSGEAQWQRQCVQDDDTHFFSIVARWWMMSWGRGGRCSCWLGVERLAERAPESNAKPSAAFPGPLL